jgi:transcriptional regulator with XRE-family HTH domain
VANNNLTPDVGGPTTVGKSVGLEAPEQRKFGDLLKQFRTNSGLTQAEAAEKLGVSRANVAQWETGRHLPEESRLRRIDDLLAAGGQLIAAAGTARPVHRLRPVEHGERATPAPRTTSLRRVWRDVRAALLRELCFDDTGRPLGWRHNLVPNDEKPSTLSTSYGLRALALLGDPHPAMRGLVDTVMQHAVRDTDDRIVGWRSRTQREPTMETTSTALDALLRVGGPITPDDVVRILRALLDDEARARPFILTCALEPLLYIAPGSDLVDELIEALLVCRVECDGVPLWPEKRVAIDQPGLRPSVVHTARAITALRKADNDRARQAVSAAEPWLFGSDNLDGVAEVIRRTAGDTYGEFTIQHFTSAWVVRAAAGAADPDGMLRRALAYLWSRYDRTRHLWTMDNGDAPVWMLADSVAAVQDAALALHPTPVESESD